MPRGFSLLSALAWVGTALVLAIALTYLLERRTISGVSLAGPDYLQEVTRALPGEEELARLRKGGDPMRLKKRLGRLLRGRKVVTVKIYDESGRLLYHSRDPKQIGKVCAANLNLKRALSGESALSLSDLSGAEHAA